MGTSENEMPQWDLDGRFFIKHGQGWAGSQSGPQLLTQAGRLTTGVLVPPLQIMISLFAPANHQGNSEMQIFNKDILMALLVTFRSVWLLNLAATGG